MRELKTRVTHGIHLKGKVMNLETLFVVHMIGAAVSLLVAVMCNAFPSVCAEDPLNLNQIGLIVIWEISLGIMLLIAIIRALKILFKSLYSEFK